VSVDQTRRRAGLDLRRYAIRPRPKKPRIIIAQVEGSGIAVTVTLSRILPMLRFGIAGVSSPHAESELPAVRRKCERVEVERVGCAKGYRRTPVSKRNRRCFRAVISMTGSDKITSEVEGEGIGTRPKRGGRSKYSGSSIGAVEVDITAIAGEIIKTTPGADQIHRIRRRGGPDCRGRRPVQLRRIELKSSVNTTAGLCTGTHQRQRCRCAKCRKPNELFHRNRFQLKFHSK